MDIVETHSETTVTLSLKGRLDDGAANELETRIRSNIDAGRNRLILDLTDVSYVNSAGLRVFIVAAKSLKPVGGRMVACSPQPMVKQVFDIAGFSTIMPIVASRDEAASRLA